MPEVLCECVRCFNSDDHLRLLPSRMVQNHIRLYGRPTAEQLEEHTQAVASREARDARRRARGVLREQAAASAQNTERDRRREPQPARSPSPELLDGDGQGDGAGGLQGMEEDDDLGGGMPVEDAQGGAAAGGEGNAVPGPPPLVNPIGGLGPGAGAFNDTVWTRQTVPGYESDEEDWLGGDEEDGIDEPADIEPPAYANGEPSHVRMAYLQAALNNVVGNVPVRLTNQNLRSQLNMLDTAGALPDFPKPAETLETAKRRLGVDPNAWIIKYTACPKCWKLYTPEAVAEMEEPSCTARDCDEAIYELKEGKNGKVKRKPFLVIPQVSLIDSVRRLLRRKGYRKKLRDNRNKPTGQNDDPSFVMKDIYDGDMWNDLKTDINREVGDRETVRDVGRDGHDGNNLSDNRFALHMTVNLDWFGCLNNRPHSTGPIYVSFNDLPREERFLQTNVV